MVETSVDILASDIVPDSGHCWCVLIPKLAAGDGEANARASQLVLFEDGKPLGPAHTLHDDIRSLGGGLFSHWGDTLYFSTSDNSNPCESGRKYTVKGPRREGDMPRGWIVHPIYTSDVRLMQTLAQMGQNPDAGGFSDVGVRNLIYCLCVSMKPRRVLEIGTHIGFGALVIGSALRLNEYGRLLTVEPGESYRKSAENYVQQAGLAEYVEFVPGFSSEKNCQQVLRNAAPFELIFIDAAHDFESAAYDIRLCAELVTENGIIILHDTGVYSPEMDPTGRGGVRAALYDFANTHPDFRATYFEYPLWLNKCGAAMLCRQKLDPPPQLSK